MQAPGTARILSLSLAPSSITWILTGRNYECGRNDGLRVGQELLDRVAIPGKPVWNEAVVAWTKHRDVQKPVDQQLARVRVKATLNRMAIDWNTDKTIPLRGFLPISICAILIRTPKGTGVGHRFSDRSSVARY